MFNVLNNLQRFWDYIVIDAGSHLSENTVTMMDAAERILLVTSPDLASLHDVSRFRRVKIIQTAQRPAAPDDGAQFGVDEVKNQCSFFVAVDQFLGDRPGG